MTQLYLNPYRPENGELQPMRKLARNFWAQYQQFQHAHELIRATAIGRWVAIETGEGAKAYNDLDWPALMGEHYAQQEGLHLVTGSMNHGLPAEVLDVMDHIVYVPQFDDVPFLAPYTAAAIVLQEIFMRTANRQGVFG